MFVDVVNFGDRAIAGFGPCHRSWCDVEEHEAVAGRKRGMIVGRKIEKVVDGKTNMV